MPLRPLAPTETLHVQPTLGSGLRALSTPLLSARSNLSDARRSATPNSVTGVVFTPSQPGIWRCPQCSATSSFAKRCPKCWGLSVGFSRSSSQASLPSSKPRQHVSSGGSVSGGNLSVAEQPREAQDLLDRLRCGKFDVSEVRDLLSRCAKAVNVREETFGWAPLFFAVHAGSDALIQLLLTARADVRASCHRGNTALHIAACGGHVGVAVLLVSKGAQLGARNAAGWTPLIWSAITGCAAVASALIERKSSLTDKDEQGRTALMWAARHGHTGVVRLLLQGGVDVSMRDLEGFTALDHAKQYEDLRKTYCRMGMVGTLESSQGDGILPGLRADGTLDVAQVLAKPEVQAEQQNELPVKVLEEAEAATRRLLTAAEGGNWEAAKEALQAGGRVSREGPPNHRTVLIWAAEQADPAAVMMLAEAKAQLESRDDFGWTPLHHAVQAGSAETVSVLHFLGADFSAKTNDGDLVVHLAARADAGPMLQLMRPLLGDLEALDSEGHTPLQTAAIRGCRTAVSTLLALRADVGARDSSERTVFALGAIHGHEAVLRVLVEPLQPLPLPWKHSELVKVLAKLPWQAPIQDRIASRKKLSRSKNHLQTITEWDSEDGSSSAAALSDRSHASENSRVSGSSRVSGRSHTSNGSDASAESHATMASRTSAKSSSSSLASHVSAQSRVSLLSRTSSSSSQLTSSRRPGGNRLTVPLSGSRPGTGQSHASEQSGGTSGSTAARRALASARAPKTPIGLLLAACKAERRAEKAPLDGGPPMLAQRAVAEVDAAGRTPLALVAHFKRPTLVARLLELRAEVNTPDRQGHTPLMLATAQGDRLAVATLLEARANVNALNAEGHRAVDMAAGSELRVVLQEQADREAVARRLRGSCSLPALARSPTGARAPAAPVGPSRLRLDGLPARHPPEHLEELLREVLQEYDVFPRRVDVAVDPITLRPCGHAYVAFANDRETRDAECTLRMASSLRVSLEAVF